jgi:2,4-dienoyl-CoA reductase-like NADH-dependent reductase (Old Yellow Enzyme family)
MCQYSATDGVPNGWHLAHLTGFASRGAAVVCAEATAVQANGRISPEDTGIWNDEQASAWKAIAGLIASQGAVPAIQLAHAGRKASSLSPFNAAGQHTVAATKEQGGWPDNVYGPTSEPYSETAAVPKEMSAQEIDGLIEDFAKAAERADRAGFGVIEIHGAQWVP